MGVVSVGEANDSPKLISNTKDKTQFERYFKVITNDINDGPLVAKFASGIPQKWSMYEFGNDGISWFCWVTDFKAERTLASPQYCLWMVTVTYETPPAQADQQQEENPLLEPAEVKMSTSVRSVPMLGYWNGSSFTGWANSAGAIYPKAPEKDVSRIELSLSLNYDITFDAVSLIKTYVDCVNSDTFWGFPAGTVKCKSITAGPKQLRLADDSDIFVYLRVDYQFEICLDDQNGEGWQLSLLDYGNYYLSGGVKTSFLTDDGHPRMGFLDGSGGDGGLVPHYLPTQNRYETIAFGNLGLPQTFAQCKAITR